MDEDYEFRAQKKALRIDAKDSALDTFKALRFFTAHPAEQHNMMACGKNFHEEFKRIYFSDMSCLDVYFNLKIQKYLYQLFIDCYVGQMPQEYFDAGRIR